MFPLVFVNPRPLFLGCVLLYLRSPRGGCCSISDNLSCSNYILIGKVPYMKFAWNIFLIQSNFHTKYHPFSVCACQMFLFPSIPFPPVFLLSSSSCPLTSPSDPLFSLSLLSCLCPHIFQGYPRRTTNIHKIPTVPTLVLLQNRNPLLTLPPACNKKRYPVQNSSWTIKYPTSNRYQLNRL